MYKDGVLTINNFQKGSGMSPFTGFGKLINCDIYSQVGTVKANTALSRNDSISSIVGTPTKIYLYGGNTYVGTDTGYVYKNGTQIASGLTNVHDLIVYKDYLIITSAIPYVYTYGPLSVFPTLHSNILSLDNLVYGYRKLALNNTDPVNGVWIGNEGYVASISSSFTGTADTGFVAHKFTLPSGRVVSTLCEYGDDLAIMTKFQNGNDKSSIIFWDKAATFGSAIGLSEISCNQMISVNNRLFYIGNDTGSLYEANKSSYLLKWSIQDRRSWQVFNNYPNAICVQNNQILFGFAPGLTTNPDPVFYAVYSYQIDKGVSIRNVISTGNYGLNQGLSISALAALGQGVYYAGWQDGSTVGVDNVNIATYAMAKVQSQMFEIGTFHTAKTFKTVEMNLGDNLPTGSSIILKYRRTMSDDFTTLRTITPLATGGVARYEDSFAVDDITTIQVEADLVPGTSNLTTPTLLSIVIK